MKVLLSKLKSIENIIGGILGGLFFGLALNGFLMNFYKTFNLELLHLIIIGVSTLFIFTILGFIYPKYFKVFFILFLDFFEGSISEVFNRSQALFFSAQFFGTLSLIFGTILERSSLVYLSIFLFLFCCIYSQSVKLEN